MKNILLVEDEWLVRSGMKTIVDWKASGFHLVADVPHGEEALDVLKQHPVDIVLTDIRMPVMDGLTLITTIRERRFPCEVVVLSSYDDFHYVRQAMRHGVRDYIHKPTMSPEELVQTLQKIAADMDERQVLEQRQRPGVDVTNRQASLLKKMLISIANNQSSEIDSYLTTMTGNDPVVEKAYYLCLLRFVGRQPSSFLSAEHLLQSFMTEHFDDPPRPSFFVNANEEWMLLLPDRIEKGLHQFEQYVGNELGWGLIWELADKKSVVPDMKAVYEQLRQRLSSKQEQFMVKHASIQKALGYIHKSYMEALTLEKVSAYVNMSPSYFSRLFLKEVGKSFIDYVTAYRLKQAKKLLLQTDIPIYEVAKRVGYRNSKYFLHLFKRQLHVTPSTYRRNYRK